jgi:TPR repeat protein
VLQNLALSKRDGTGCTRDRARAYALIRESSNNGFPSAMSLLSTFLRDDLKLVRDLSRYILHNVEEVQVGMEEKATSTREKLTQLLLTMGYDTNTIERFSSPPPPAPSSQQQSAELLAPREDEPPSSGAAIMVDNIQAHIAKEIVAVRQTSALLGNPVAAFNLCNIYRYGTLDQFPIDLQQARYWMQVNVL